LKIGKDRRKRKNITSDSERKEFRENAEKERRIEGIGIELVNGDDRRAMLLEKKCEVILMRSSMAEEKTLENEENGVRIYLFFFFWVIFFFSLFSAGEGNK